MSSTVISELPPVVAEHIAAVNTFDTDCIVATFAPDAYVNDNRREIRGTEAIRAFITKEFVGDNVTMDVAPARNARLHCPLADLLVR